MSTFSQLRLKYEFPSKILCFINAEKDAKYIKHFIKMDKNIRETTI